MVIVEAIPIERRGDFVVTMYDLDEETCRRMLGGTRFGRVVVDDGDGPVAFPVNALFTHDRVLFRVAEGSVLDRAAERAAAASYQVDDIDRVAESGWSILVRGQVAPLADDAIAAAVADTDVRPWAPGRHRWIELPARRITGRLIRRHRHGGDGPHSTMPPG